jgi:acyl-CoA thioesterase I
MPQYLLAPRQRFRRARPRLIALALLACLALATALAACGPASPKAATTIRPAQSPPPITYVAIGASDAFGVGTYFPIRDNWPTALAHLLGSDVHLVNLGIPGETVATASQTELPIALDAKPELITVWLGVNDIVASVPVERFEKQLEMLLRSLHQNTTAPIFVGNIPDLTLLPFFARYDHAALQATIAQWNGAIAQAVNASGATLVDLFSTWNELAEHPEYISGDGFHPSTVGAERLAEVFQARIAPTLPAIRAAAGLA